MNQNICYNCGGEFVNRGGKLVCLYCGTVKPENISGEELTLLYTAFQRLRIADFSDAEQEFDDIIRRHPCNAQAYWGRLLARYGIKYEDDYDGTKIPSCYAASIESVFDASDYKKALELADADNRAVFREHAEYIERCRRDWIEEANREKPYDIFISYKDSDKERGIKRTEDSVTMQDLYVQLVQRGYRVFFSHESLRGISGKKYEPYIFNALSTAKVMIVYASNPEYIKSTWVKNEWTRYLKRMRAGEKTNGSLLVAYEGFSPMELPGTLASLQCLDASEKRFYTDLFEAIERILSEGSVKNKSETVTNTSQNPRCNHKPIPIPGNPPTCTEDGSTEGAYCPLCGEMLKKIEVIPATGHRFSDWQIAKPASCTEDGEHARTCHCGARETKKIPARGTHIPGQWTTAKEATEYAEGLKVKKCVVCGEQVASESIPKKRMTNAPSKTAPQKTTAQTPAPTSSANASNSCNVKLVSFGAQKLACVKLVRETFGLGLSQAMALVESSEKILAKDVSRSEAERIRGIFEKNGFKVAVESGTNHAESKVSANASAVKQENTVKKTSSQTKNESQGLAYTVNADGKTCSVKGQGTCTDKDIVIPETINGYKVTGIITETKASSRYDISGFDKAIKSVSIPDSVTSIGEKAFWNCTSLASVVISDSVMSIGNGAFSDCTSLASVTIPDSVTSIGARAFYNCMSLASVNIPDSITSIGGSSFSRCTSLAGVTIPDSVTSIGDSSFSGCDSLASVNIPDSVTSIGDGAFSGCTSLASVVIPDSVTSIGNSAFRGCTNLASVNIPNSVTSIGWNAFDGCTSLASVTIPDSVMGIGNGAFAGCKSLASVNIPDSVTSIGNWAFQYCTSLASIRYDGTKKQWKKISLGIDWKKDSAIRKIECTNGSIKI